MPHVWKEVLLPGTQYNPDGSHYTFTRRQVREGLANAQRMLARKVPLPCVWEHQDVEAGDTAEWRANYAKYTFGHIDGARLNSRGALELRHDVPDPADVRQLFKTKFVSPKVFPLGYSDSKGGRYNGLTVAHVAATPTPVQFWQRPFQLSRAGSLYLSYHMADEATPPEKPAEGGADAELGELMEALRSKGMTISDKVASIHELIIAIESSGGPGDVDADADLDEPVATGGGEDQTTAAGSAPMLMSSTDRNPAVRQQVAAWTRDERADMAHRVKNLFQSGRCTRPEALKLRRQASAVEMSFTRDGDLVCPLAKKIAELEAKPVNSAWEATAGNAPVNLSTTRGVPVPDALTGDTDNSKLMDFMCAGLPGKK